jgi:hypothetical protein
MRTARRIDALVVAVITLAGTVSAGMAWERITALGPAPSPRRGVAGIHDPQRQRLVFQGAETADVRFLPDVWFFDLETVAWEHHQGSGPTARCHHTFLLDAGDDRALLFGGFPRTNELWSFQPSTNQWHNITPVASPAPRCLHASVLCPSRREMVVYGGLQGGFLPDLPDTWSYDVSVQGLP